MKKYQIIYADPPWNYSDKSTHRGGAARHYSSPTLDDLKRLDVLSISQENIMQAGTYGGVKLNQI